MPISLDSFVGVLSDTVRPNRFECIVNPPSAIGLPDSGDLKFFIQGATLPDRTFAEIELKYYGMTLKVPGNESMSDLTVTVLNDIGWVFRTYFEEWANVVNDRDTSAKGYTRDLLYDSSVIVRQLDGKGNVVAKYIFLNIYPKTVSEIELNMETNDSVETYQITFGYSHWKRMPLREE